ncbi:zinc finger transcription factor YY1 [Aegilops tauschii subsp. strangulata]|uniref:zinc finger transcription factor YY1 n=1 Tax=Aegilops tauschii subsp. strangulata TaxID=200361 RepID=UPI00098AD633|nr:zinc finger transcription factor YY1 [Aegilops tauschii subsp. strangulata]
MEYAAAGAGGYYYYPPAQQPQPPPQTLRRRPRPAARWVKQWIPQDLASPGSKCALFKWVREDVYKNLKENGGAGQEPEAQPRKVEPATEILFLCSYDNCGKTFVDVAALRKHAHVHGERQYVCQEPGCGKKFVDSSKLKRHHLTHTGQKDFVCPHPGCGKAFSLDFNLRAHLKTHAVENYHICPFPACGKRFTSDFKLKCHIKTHEKTGSPIAVQHTPPAEKPQSTIKPSIQATPKPSAPTPPSFSSERPYVCPYEGCGKAYIHGYKLNLHLKTQHPDHNQENNGRSATPAAGYNYADGGDIAPNPKRSKTNQGHRAPPSNAYNVKVSSRMAVDTSGAKNQWPGKGMYDDDSEETEEDPGGNNVEDGWRYGNQNADDEETEEDED